MSLSQRGVRKYLLDGSYNTTRIAAAFLAFCRCAVVGVPMNRRWQKEATDRYRNLESYGSFLSNIQTLDNDIGICDSADLYAAYSVLHSKRRSPRLCVNQDPGFHYFLAEVVVVTRTSEEQQAAAGGKEQPGATAHTPASSEAVVTDRQLPQQPLEEVQEMQAEVIIHDVRLEPVVPVSSKCSKLTFDTLQQLFKLEAHPNVSHILLAIVDDDGSVSLVRTFSYVQPPFEGPESLPLLEGAEGGAVPSSDDD